jgi:hypothetical protein
MSELADTVVLCKPNGRRPSELGQFPAMRRWLPSLPRPIAALSIPGNARCPPSSTPTSSAPPPRPALRGSAAQVGAEHPGRRAPPIHGLLLTHNYKHFGALGVRTRTQGVDGIMADLAINIG